jgi:hypothetical protein
MMVDTTEYESHFYVHETDEDPLGKDYFDTLEDAILDAIYKAKAYSNQYAITQVLFKEVGTTQATVTFETN